MDVVWFGLLVVGVAVLGMLAGGGRSREDIRARRRWDSAFEHDSRRLSRTDATGVLVCRFLRHQRLGAGGTVSALWRAALMTLRAVRPL